MSQPVTRTYTTTQQPTTTTSTVIRQPTTTTTTVNRPSYLNSSQTVQVTRVRESGFRKTANERRLDEFSARELARMVFRKYDDNGSGYMNSQESAQMITDLYASLNEHNPSNPNDGYDFMVANDANSDNSMSLQDFEDIFVKYLSTGTGNSGFRLFFDQTQLQQEQAPDYVYHPPTVHSDGLHETRIYTRDSVAQQPQESIPTKIVG
jgi:hypothetical protein